MRIRSRNRSPVLGRLPALGTNGTSKQKRRPLEDEEHIRAQKAKQQAARLAKVKRQAARAAEAQNPNPEPKPPSQPKVKQRRTEYHDETSRSVRMEFNNVGRGKRSR